MEETIARWLAAQKPPGVTTVQEEELCHGYSPFSDSFKFETTEQENSYNEWLRTKVTSSLADTRPAIPHDEVMAEMENLIAQIAVTNKSE